MIKREYNHPEVIVACIFDTSSPLCASTGGLPDMEESDDMGNLEWN